MNADTTDERAHWLAPRLSIAQQNLQSAAWVNPGTGTICQLEESGDFEVWHRQHDVLKPVVIGRITPVEAAPLVRNPYSEPARRAAANAIVGVDCAQRVS